MSVLSVSHLSKKFSRQLRQALRYGVQDVIGELLPRRRAAELRAGEFWALDDVSFTLAPGEALAIVGGNGAGKSTLLKVLSGLLKPDRGEVRLRGRAGALIELGTGVNPTLTGRENVSFGAAMHGLTAAQRTDFEHRAVAFADLGAFIDAPVQSYSAGMRARLGYAIAAQLDPAVLLVDEVLAVGDLAFQHKCARHIASYLERGGALLFVSHNTHQIQSICSRAILLDCGRVAFSGTAVDTLNEMFERRLLAPVETTAPCAVEAISIEAVLAEPVAGDAIRVGEAVRIRLRYRSTIHTEVIWGFSIYTGDGWTFVVGEHDPAFHTLGPGPGELTCLIPRLPLVGGRYALRGALLDRATRQPLAMSGRGHPGGVLDVRSERSAVDNMRMAHGQLVQVDVRWDP